jgi:hypothetical protein
MSIDEHKRVVAGLVDQVWNQYDATAIDRYFGPGLWEEVAEHYQQLLRGFPDLQVTIEDDLIAEATGSSLLACCNSSALFQRSSQSSGRAAVSAAVPSERAAPRIAAVRPDVRRGASTGGRPATRPRRPRVRSSPHNQPQGQDFPIVGQPLQGS